MASNKSDDTNLFNQEKKVIIQFYNSTVIGKYIILGIGYNEERNVLKPVKEEIKPQQLMSYNKQGDENFPFFYDSEILREILTANNVADLPIALYSVAGKYRSGKSFFLNLFIHLLQYETLPENLDLNDSTYGFQWLGGRTAHTDGIWITNKPFILEKTDGTKVRLVCRHMKAFPDEGARAMIEFIQNDLLITQPEVSSLKVLPINVINISKSQKIFKKMFEPVYGIALFFMDTEGTEEPSKSSNVTNAVFTMSTLLSSFQIFNMRYPNSEEELRKLHLISSLGEHCTKNAAYVEEEKTMTKQFKKLFNPVNLRSAWSNRGSEKSETQTLKNSILKRSSNHSKTNIYPFQNLLILIRDFPSKDIEKENGSFQCGKKVLEDYLKEKDLQDKKVRDVRCHIKTAFESIECYVVRNPGEDTTERAEETEPLLVKDVNPDFLGQIKDLFNCIFSEENIVVKKINGLPVTCSQLYEYSQVLLKVYQSGKVPQAVDIIQATDESTMRKARKAGIKKYETQMDEKCGKKYVKDSDLKKFHKECKLEAMKTIEGIQCLGSEEDRARHIEEFQHDIEQLWQIKQLKNDLNKSETIKEISKIFEDVTKKHEKNLKEKTSESKLMSEKDFEKLVDSEQNKSVEEFKKATTQYDSDLLEQPFDDLAQKLMLINASLINNNQNNLEKCRHRIEKEETDLTEDYDNSMHQKCYQQSIKPSKFLQIHRNEKKAILRKFDDCFNDLPDFLKKPARENLDKKIEKKKNRYEDNNSLNLKKEKKDLATLSRIEDYYKDRMLEKINGVYVDPQEIKKFHLEAKEKAFYYAKQNLGENYDERNNDLIALLNFAKKDFKFSNDNLQKKEVVRLKQRMEFCYDEYNSRMNRMIKSQYHTDIQEKHNLCKYEAVDEYQKYETELLDDFLSVKSKLEQKIDNRLKLYEDQNKAYEKTEDHDEEQAWNDAESDFKLKIKKAMNENDRRKDEKVQELYLERTNELIKEYRRKVATRFNYKEKKLEDQFKTIFDKEEEAGRCVVM